MNAPLRVAQRGLTIGARGTYNRHKHLKIMEAAALDLHLLVRLDSKSAPRARSFRERTEVRLLCVSDACALDALAHLCLTMSTQAPRWMRASAKSMRAATYLLPF